MNGMLMMLKSFGIDPEMIQQSMGQFQNLAAQFAQEIHDIKTTQGRIEEKLDLLIQNPVLNQNLSGLSVMYANHESEVNNA